MTGTAPYPAKRIGKQRHFQIASRRLTGVALLERTFNLAITWDLYFGLNPVRKVKFFREITNRLRVLRPEDEEKLLQSAIPYLQDLIRFASRKQRH